VARKAKFALKPDAISPAGSSHHGPSTIGPKSEPAKIPGTMSSKDKVLIVTGASRGIGATTAHLAAARGFEVCVNYHQQHAAAEKVVAAIRQKGGRAIAIQADVSNEADVVRLFANAATQLGPITALVNNAGIVERQTRLDQIDAARLQRVFSTNVFSHFLCAREAVRRMSTRNGGEGGAIVNVSSAASRIGSPNEYIDYAASKGAIDTLTLGLAKEVAEENIRVNAVRPGIIHTDIHAAGGEPDRVERVRKGIPMQRGGQPEEVASAILWLLSDEASYVTGAILDVTGGR
jgi:NAD(P)-dependent dehydrogenase (short-subunit alcohol dehydrogenase family)